MSEKKKKSIKDMTDLEFAKYFSTVREKILTDPIRFFIRSEGLINFSPTPAQMVALKCIFNQRLDSETKYMVYQETVDEFGAFDLEQIYYTEVELYKLMTGFDYEQDGAEKARNRINLIVGRRGGKTTLAAIVAIYSTIKVNWTPYLTKTPVATVLVLSHSVDLSEEILDILKQLVESSELLNRLRNLKKKNTTKIFHLKIPFLKEDGESVEWSQVRVKVGAASKKTTRGSAVCTLLCDEIAFWNLSEEAAEPDHEIIRAARMSLLQFGEHGTIIKMSSPGIKQGVLYDEWQRRDEIKDDYIQFKAPSWVWNTILPKEEFKKEQRLDPEGFDTELRANFVDSITNFILPEFVDLCVMRGISFNPPSDDRQTIYSGAIDAAFKGDRFAFSVVGYNEKRVTQYVLKYWEGSKKRPVQIHEVAAYIRTICRQYGLNEIAGDQYSFQPLRELFLQYGINLVENVFTLPYKRKIYFGLKRLIHNQQMDLLDIPLLSKEIKELVVEQTASGQIRIGHPQNGSDDLADATAVAAYRVMERAGGVQVQYGEVVMSNDYGVRVDIQGRAFTAPPVELLHNYQGFADVIDNSKEWVKDPQTGKWRKLSEIEEEQGVAGSDQGNFIF
jgi:hypothetical protein